MSRLRALLLRLHRDEQGAAMTEFVLVFPLQLFLTLLVLQFAFLAQAVVVVAQAAHMGARAAAVADLSGMSASDSAKRVAARTCGVLTSGAAPATPGTPPTGGTLRWRAEGGGNEITAVRQQEAYGHLSVTIGQYPQEGYVACDLSYDYALWVPVANALFAQLGDGAGEFNDASMQRRQPVFRIRRVGFIATPWTKPPGGGGSGTGTVGVVNPPGP